MVLFPQDTTLPGKEACFKIPLQSSGALPGILCSQLENTQILIVGVRGLSENQPFWTCQTEHPEFKALNIYQPL